MTLCSASDAPPDRQSDTAQDPIATMEKCLPHPLYTCAGWTLLGRADQS